MKTFPSVLFVCTGNICRSPTAEIIWSRKLKDLGFKKLPKFDSAGTTAYHVGEAPDYRMQRALRGAGYQPFGRSRLVHQTDIQEFDLVIGMSNSHIRHMRQTFADYAKLLHRLNLFSELCDLNEVTDIPDPYYGGEDGFINVVRLIENGCDNLIRKIKMDQI
ncbi:MAG: low molecular weight phosphotyrosine protein phosphatase [Opitutales bacterium]|nr:low molecular weight phosphotyrosine protein phosphatase [Opitutales bacterium]